MGVVVLEAEPSDREVEAFPGPVVLGEPVERLRPLPARSTRRPEHRGGSGPAAPTAGQVLVRSAPGEPGPYAAVPDDNRGAVIPGLVVPIGGRGYAVGLKGVGARVPLYGDSTRDYTLRDELGRPPPAGVDVPSEDPRLLTRELWYGEAPYGGQGTVSGTYGLQVTDLADGVSINGFHICPVLELNEFPEEVTALAADQFWYRRYDGPILQEQRLVPSNVRLFHQSEVTLGQHLPEVLRAFGVDTPPKLDSFIDAYTRSGVAALTLFVRTMRPVPFGIHGLDYANVWLDKDCLVAPDGTLHFADLEGLEWVLAGQDWTVEEHVREQFEHNFYEFMYGLDLLVRESERRAGRTPDQAQRRRSLVPRLELALERDRFVRLETGTAGADLVVLPPMGDAKDVVVRLLDLG